MTLATLIGVPGFEPFARLLEAGYAPYDCSLSWPGVVVGAGFGFLEAFVWVGAFAWLYNRLFSRETVLRPYAARDPARSAPRQPQP